MAKTNGTGLSLRDSSILTMAYRGMSAEEIGAELQVAPERISLEIDRLTKTVDWLSDLQKYKLAMHGLQSLIGALREKAESGNDPHLVKAYLDGLKMVFEQIAAQSAKVDGDIERVQNAQARVLVDIVDRAFYYTLGKLEKRLEESGIDRSEIEETFRGGLVAIAAEFDQRDED